MISSDRYNKDFLTRNSIVYAFLLGLFLFANNPFTLAQNAVVLKAAELKIAGKTNVSDFSCNLRNVHLNDTLSQVTAAINSPEVFNGLQLIFNVSEFTCDLPLMTKDFQDLLQSKEHPHILLTITDIHYNQSTSDQSRGNITTSVQLRIADKTRMEKIDRASIHTIRNKTILSGTHAIRMTAFDIQPPIKFFGTVRTQDLLEIQFNIQLE